MPRKRVLIFAENMERLGKMNRSRDVKETIRNWAQMANYPEEFLHFFIRWTLLNLYYNELSHEDRETDRVLDFGRQHEQLFELLKDRAYGLMLTECIGDGEETNPPNRWVKTATLHLREVLKIDPKPICESCRSDKWQLCQNVALESYAFGNMEALIRVLYQIRCNLFHGDKTEYKDAFQVNRNKMLVGIGNNMIETILRSLSM